MMYREIAAEFKQLPVDERLMLLEELARSLRLELAESNAEPQKQTARLWRGMLKSAAPPPSDEEIDSLYVDYLVEKYQ